MSDAAVATIVGGIITMAGMVIGFLTLYLRLKYGDEKVKTVEEKLDHNTKITQSGTEAAVVNAKSAVIVAASTKEAVEDINKKLNGGIDAAIDAALAPIRKTIEDHVASDDRNMIEIRLKFDEMEKYIHLRNHDIISAINGQSLRMETAIARLSEQTKATS